MSNSDDAPDIDADDDRDDNTGDASSDLDLSRSTRLDGEQRPESLGAGNDATVGFDGDARWFFGYLVFACWGWSLTPFSFEMCSLDMPTTAAQDFAARAVQKAYRDWREMRIQFVKGMAWKTTLNVDDEEANSPHNETLDV